MQKCDTGIIYRGYLSKKRQYMLTLIVMDAKESTVDSLFCNTQFCDSTVFDQIARMAFLVSCSFQKSENGQQDFIICKICFPRF